jgi:hypothetical protein
MAYVDGLLASGEQVLRRERQHWILPFYIAGRWVAIAVAVFLLSLVVNVWIIPGGGDGFLGGIASFISTLLAWITAIALVIAVVGFAWSAAIWQTQEYVLTNQRVVHVRGVVNKTSSDSVLESLTDAQIQIPFLGRAMGWGNLVLMTANESGNMKMLALRDPVEFKKAVFDAKTNRQVALNTGALAFKAGAPAPAPAPAPPAPEPVAPTPAAANSEDVTRTLTALAGLRDSGAITADEYEAKKKELLGRI